MRRQLTTTQKGLVLVLIPVCFELLFILIAFNMVEDAASDLEKLEHSKDVIQDLYSAQNWLVRTFIVTLSDHQPQKSVNQLDHLEKQFKESKWTQFADNRFPELNNLQNDLQELSKTVSHVIGLKRKEYLSKGTYVFPRPILYNAFLDMRSASDRILAIEQRVGKAEPEELNRVRNNLILFLAAGVVLSLAISIGLARYFTADIFERLLRLTESAHRLAARETVDMPVSKADEIGSLETIIYQSSRDLKEIRERENAILDNAADVICSLDRKFRFTGVNAAAARLWHYSEDDLLGKALAALLVAEDIDPTRAQLQLISEGPGEGAIENRIRTKDGDLRNLLWTVKWSSAESQFFCVVHDVTELRKLQKMKQQFLAIAGHDLRSPLASVSLILERLLSKENDQLSGAAQKELTKTREILGRLMDLVNELLELEKLESGKFAIATDCASAFDICVLSCQNLETMATRAGVRIEKPNNDFAILADERRLVQTVTNLLSNAIKFAPKGSAVVMELRRVVVPDSKEFRTASVGTRNGTRNMIEIRVTDRGPGITPEEQSLIFEKFRQAKTAATSNEKSTGLGLAIVKAIALAHGGEVGLESEPGRGSTFWLSIPEFEDQEESL